MPREINRQSQHLCIGPGDGADGPRGRAVLTRTLLLPLNGVPAQAVAPRPRL